MSCPPNWSDSLSAFQADLAALDRLDDELWRIARSQRSEADSLHLHDMLEKNSEEMLTANEHLALKNEVIEADSSILRKAHASALLPWRGHIVPLSQKL